MVSPLNSTPGFLSTQNSADSSEEEVVRVPLTGGPEVAGRAFRFVVGHQRPLIIGPSSVGFINQANTTIEECRAQASHLCLLLNSEVNIDVVYSPVSGIFATHCEDAVRLLRAGWDDWFASSPGRPRLQFCCGASTHIVTAALREYVHAQLITVVVIAPSSPIPRELCHRVVYYRAYGDITSICYGTGLGEEIVVLPRHPESLGTFDNSFASSTFIEAIQWEYQLFCSEESGSSPQRRVRVPGTSVQVVVMANSVDEAVSLGLVSASSFNNLYEEAMNPPYPRDCLAWSTALTGTIRRIILATDAMFLMGLFPGSLRVQLYLGVCLFIGANTVRSVFIGYIPRRQNVRSRLRTVALRAVSLEYFQSAYELPFLLRYIFDPGTPTTLRAAFGILVLFLGPAAVLDSGARFFSPLRERIQHIIIRSEEESVVEQREGENVPAGRVGLSLGIQGTVIWGVVGGIIGAVTSSMFNSALYEPFGPSPSNQTFDNNTLTNFSDSTNEDSGIDLLRTSYSTVLTVYGALSLVSVVLNSLSLRRMLRYRPQQAEALRAEEVEEVEEEEESSNNGS